MRDSRPKAARSRFASRCRECPPGFVRSDAGCRWSLLGSGTPVIRTRPVRSFAAWPPHRPCEGRNSETIRVARHRRQTNVGDCFSRVGENEEPYNPVSRDCFDSSCFPFHPSNPPELGNGCHRSRKVNPRRRLWQAVALLGPRVGTADHGLPSPGFHGRAPRICIDYIRSGS